MDRKYIFNRFMVEKPYCRSICTVSDTVQNICIKECIQEKSFFILWTKKV